MLACFNFPSSRNKHVTWRECFLTFEEPVYVISKEFRIEKKKKKKIPLGNIFFPTTSVVIARPTLLKGFIDFFF